MNARAKVFLKIVSILAIFGLLIFFLDFQKFGRELSKVSTIAVILCIGGELLFYAIESVKLLYLGSFKYSFSLILKSRFLTAFLANFAPGLIVGDVLRVFILDRYRPGNKLHVASMLVSSRLYGVLPLALILPVSALLNPRLVDQFKLPLILGCVCLGLIAWISPLFVGYRWSRRIVFSSYRFSSVGVVRNLIRKIYFSFRIFGTRRNWLVASGTSLATTLIVIAEFWILSRALGLGVSFSEWALIVSVVSVVTFLPIGIGAIGSQDAALAMMASLFGQSLESFIAVSLLMHIVRIIGTLPGAVFVGEGFDAFRVLRKNKVTQT